MEAREGMSSGVTVVESEDLSNYHMGPRIENSTQVTGGPAMVTSDMTTRLAGAVAKKKRGRPRKYGPEGATSKALSTGPVSTSAPRSTSNFSAHKQQAKGKPNGLEKQRRKVGVGNSGDLVEYSAGGNFMPHVIHVNAGEDITMKIISFSQQGPRAICIISALGSISNVTIRQPDSSGGTLTYEGRFEILSLCGSFAPADVEGSRTGRAGSISITFTGADGRVVGGPLAGLLIAASPVQVVVGSFLHSTHHELKPKKQKSQSKLTTSPPGFSATPPAFNAGNEGFGAQNLNFASPSSAFGSENWPGYDAAHARPEKGHL